MRQTCQLPPQAKCYEHTIFRNTKKIGEVIARYPICPHLNFVTKKCELNGCIKNLRGMKNENRADRC